MPLIAAATIAYAAGLLSGFGGAFAYALVPLVTVALVAALHRAWRVAALTGFALAGLAAAHQAAAGDAHCRSVAPTIDMWRVTLDDAVTPGAFARGRAVSPRCARTLAVSVAVEHGYAAAGEVVAVSGQVTPTRRGILIQHALVSATGQHSALTAARATIASRLDHAFRDDAPMARALLIADTRSLDPAIRDRFADAGLVHMLSISGLHVAIIAAAIQLLLQIMRLPRGAAAAATIALTALYIAVIGAPPPALRSGVMLGVAATARMLQRPTSPWSSLAIGAAVPLIDPRVVLDIGFQLSVAGMAALVASGAAARRWVAPRANGWRAQLATLLLASSLALVVTAPLVTWRFGRLSLISPFSNLVAAPIIALAQPALFVAMLCLPSGAVARFVADAVHPLLAAFEGVATVASRLPYASVGVAPTLAGALLAGVASMALIVACVSHFPGRALLVGAGAITIGAWLPLLPHVERMAELHMIDVGQGDAVAVRTPRGRWVLFDAGRAWRGGDAGRTMVVPYLRRRGGDLLAFVLSHPHDDHVGGATSVLGALHPREYLDGAFVGGGAAYYQSLIAAQRHGVRWRRARPGDSLSADGVTVHFLAPDSAWVTDVDDANEASTVAVVRYGAVRFLLVGDAERGEEAWLLARDRDALSADVLKVGHHGSATSSTPDFLAAVRPRLSLVSVGAGNGYGHPNPGVLRALAASGAQVLRTDHMGSVVIRTDGQRIEVEAEGDTWTLPKRSRP